MRISDRCYVLHGLGAISPWMVNAGFIVGEEETLVVDCGYTYMSAQTILGYARAVRPQNRVSAVNTEPHSDHMGGNCLFREKGIDVYGHSEIRRSPGELADVKNAYREGITNPVRHGLHEEEAVFLNTRFANPNKPVFSEITLDLGSVEARLLMTPGHTPQNLSVFVPSEGSLFTGDVLVPGYIPHLAEGTSKDWEDWLASLERVRELSPRMIIPGHGPVLEQDEIPGEIERTMGILREALASGRPPAP